MALLLIFNIMINLVIMHMRALGFAAQAIAIFSFSLSIAMPIGVSDTSESLASREENLNLFVPSMFTTTTLSYVLLSDLCAISRGFLGARNSWKVRI